MLFIMDEIAAAVESVVGFVEEKVTGFKDPTSWERSSSSSSKNDDCETQEQPKEGYKPMTEDEFDNYLADCAMSMLFPCGVPETIKKQWEEEKRKEEETAMLKKRQMVVNILKTEGIKNLCTEDSKEIVEVLNRLGDPELPDKDRKQMLDSLKGKTLTINVGELLGLDHETAAVQESEKENYDGKKDSKE